jgi:hypothetical protein
MTLPVEEDETPAPVDIGLLGAIGVVAKPDGLAKAIKKADRRPGRRIDRRGRTGWTIPAGDATIRGRRLFGPIQRHAPTFGPLCILLPFLGRPKEWFSEERTFPGRPGASVH